MQYSYHRNFTVANISQGKYANIRLMAGDSQHSRSWPWKTAAQSIADGNASSPDYSLFQFSAACWYFAEVLTNILGSEAPPLGHDRLARARAVVRLDGQPVLGAVRRGQLQAAQHGAGLRQLLARGRRERGRLCTSEAVDGRADAGGERGRRETRAPNHAMLCYAMHSI